jgi:AcrR family transcriptional regulator
VTTARRPSPPKDEPTLVPEEGTEAAVAARDPPSALVESLIEAAVRCFARFGAQRTRIEDVAQAADVSRATFYRYFQTREQLIDAVVLHQLNEVVALHGPAIRRARTLKTAIARGSASVLLACRENEVFMELLHRARGERLSDLAQGTSDFFQPVAEVLWVPALEAARERGELKPGLDTAEIVRWISSVHLLFLLRDHLTAEEVEHAMNVFVTPALVR